jgi:hypothetical protein
MNPENNWIKFSFGQIRTYLENNREVKDLKRILPKGYGTYTTSQIDESKPSMAVRTGKVSGITVYDVDDKDVYETMMNEHPELKDCYTVSTNRGYHIYFNYDERPRNNSSSLTTYGKVDIRNNGGIAIMPPTKYKLLDGTTVKYKCLGGKLIDVPEYLIAALKGNAASAKQPKAGKQRAPKDGVAVYGNVEKYTIKQLESLVALLDVKRADDYEQWILVGIILNKYNSTKESFDLWETFSKRSKKYEKGGCATKWNGFSDTNYEKLTIGTLKYYARQDNPEGYALLADMFEDIDHFETYDINQRYILAGEHEEAIKKMLKAWYKSVAKLFAIKSAYDTGKTKTLLYLMEKLQPERVLIITYRQTLSHNMYGSFKDYDFGNYLNGDFKSDRLICQVESLHKLISHNMFTDKFIIPKYDLVIIDESESVLNHTESPTIKCKSNTFQVMDAILRKSSKIIALDGDFGNRSYDYFKTLNDNEDFVVLRNKCVPYVKTWNFTNDEKSYGERLVRAVNGGKKIFICSMSSEQAMRYEAMLKAECKCQVLLHSSKSDDGLKEKLQDVNALWIQYDVVIITPTVEAGVDFNVDHFDQMYTILSNKSTSQRGLLQMTARVRKLKNLNNEVYLNHIPFSYAASLYTFDEVDVMYNAQLMGDNLQLDDDNNLSANSPFTNISKHNRLELLNKNQTYFVPYLLKLLSRKKQKYSFDGTTTKQAKDDDGEYEEQEAKINYTKQRIFDAEQVGKEGYEILIKHQSSNKATEDDKYAIERYLYCFHWDIAQKDLTRDMLDDIYRQTGVLFNHRALMGQEVKSFSMTDGRGNDMDVKVRNKKMKHINEMLRMLEFKDDEDKFIADKRVEGEDFIKLTAKALKKCALFTDKTVHALFDMEKKAPATNKAFLGYANSFLDNYGVKIQSQKYGKDKKKLRYCIQNTLPTFAKND